MKLTTAFAAIAAMILFPSEGRAEHLNVQHLSDSHALVRVDTKDRYLLLPVQERAEEVTLNLLVDTDLKQQIDIRLAVTEVDYFVPLDLAPYSGKSILLDITRKADARPQLHQMNLFQDNLCWKEMKTSSAFDTANREKYRPSYHFSPAYGWMNDPNGMVYKDGEYHLFFQFNPYGSLWGNMTWGHAVTRDLVHWEQLDPAIAPNALGTVFSGSAVVDEDNVSGFGRGAIVAMYTSAGTDQTQSLAYSLDNGRTFRIYAGNPVIVSDVPDFRDPKLFWDPQTKQWKVILAAGQEVQFYASDNLRDWTFESSFGLLYGSHNGVWECPDLVKLPLPGGGYKHVLILNINPGGPFGGSATQYFIGEYDGHTFRADEAPSVTRWMDYGKDHYATVTWSGAPGGRTIALAWMSNWQYAAAVPTRQFRSANSVPRDLSLIRRGGEILLKSAPSPEVEALRGKAETLTLTSGTKTLFPEARSTYELILTCRSPKEGRVTFTLSNSRGEEVLMSYDAARNTFEMDRRASGETGFSRFFPAVTAAPAIVKGKLTLRLLVDSCSIEAFGDDFAMTNLVFPSEPYNTLAIQSGSPVDVTIYPLNK